MFSVLCNQAVILHAAGTSLSGMTTQIPRATISAEMPFSAGVLISKASIASRVTYLGFCLVAGCTCVTPEQFSFRLEGLA